MLLELHPNNERDYYRALIVAAGGYFLAGVDGKVSPEEEDNIIEYLSNFTVQPKLYLQGIKDKIGSREELHSTMIEAVHHLMQVDPEERYPLFNYLCSLVMVDRELDQEEINFIMDIAVQHLGMHEIEASRIFINNLQATAFKPRF